MGLSGGLELHPIPGELAQHEKQLRTEKHTLKCIYSSSKQSGAMHALQTNLLLSSKKLTPKTLGTSLKLLVKDSEQDHSMGSPMEDLIEVVKSKTISAVTV